MLRNHEQTVRLSTDAGTSVDGVIRIRGLGVDLQNVKFAVERHDPVAVLVEQRGHSRRIALTDGNRGPSWLAWAAAPAIAVIVSRTLRKRRKKDA